MEITGWDLEFCKVDQGTLFELILVRPAAFEPLRGCVHDPLTRPQASNFLDINSMLNLLCKNVASMMKGAPLQRGSTLTRRRQEGRRDPPHVQHQERLHAGGGGAGPQGKRVVRDDPVALDGTIVHRIECLLWSQPGAARVLTQQGGTELLYGALGVVVR